MAAGDKQRVREQNLRGKHDDLSLGMGIAYHGSFRDDYRNHEGIANDSDQHHRKEDDDEEQLDAVRVEDFDHQLLKGGTLQYLPYPLEDSPLTPLNLENPPHSLDQTNWHSDHRIRIPFRESFLRLLPLIRHN